jgi:hypothetical protein
VPADQLLVGVVVVAENAANDAVPIVAPLSRIARGSASQLASFSARLRRVGVVIWGLLGFVR